MRSFVYEIVRCLKAFVYGPRGEPYKIGKHVLRYVPGTRPVRIKYLASENLVARYDAWEVKILMEGVVAGDIIFDIGAHTGEYCILLSALTGPTGKVVAFEPDRHARVVLDKNISLNPSIKPPTVESYAVSDEAGGAVLFSKGGNANSSLIPGATGGSPDVENESINIEMITLDSYIDTNGIIPNWIKIDTEGAEIKIIKGAEKILGTDCNFLVELHPYAWDEFGNIFEEFKEAAKRANRRIRYIDEAQEFTGEPHYGVVVLEKI